MRRLAILLPLLLCGATTDYLFGGAAPSSAGQVPVSLAASGNGVVQWVSLTGVVPLPDGGYAHIDAGYTLTLDSAGLVDLFLTSAGTPAPLVAGPLTLDGGAEFGTGSLSLYNVNTPYTNATAIFGNTEMSLSSNRAELFYLPIMPDGGAASGGPVGEVQYSPAISGVLGLPTNTRLEAVLGDGGCVDGVATEPSIASGSFTTVACTREGGQVFMADGVLPTDGLTREQLDSSLANRDGGGVFVPIGFGGVVAGYAVPGSAVSYVTPFWVAPSPDGGAFADGGQIGVFTNLFVVETAGQFPDAGLQAVSTYTDGGYLQVAIVDSTTGTEPCSANIRCVPIPFSGVAQTTYQITCTASIVQGNLYEGAVEGQTNCTWMPTVQIGVQGTLFGLATGGNP